MKYKSKLPDRRKAAQAIEDMAADLQARGLTLWGIYPPMREGGTWALTMIDGGGETIWTSGDTLDGCYLAAMNYPDTPPPF
jgi:hypothetical protein